MFLKNTKIPILRYGIIVLLISLLFSGVIYLYAHYNNAQKLQAGINKLMLVRANTELIDSALLKLYNADNNSRLYSVTGDKVYLRTFYGQISDLNKLLEKINFNSGAADDANSDKLRRLVVEKASKTNDYIKLRLLTDSLIHATLKIDSTLGYARVKIPVRATSTIKTSVHVDTIKTDTINKIKSPQKKSFFKRIVSVIARNKNKQKANQNPALLVKRDTVTKTIVQAHTVYRTLPKTTRNYYRKLFAANNQLRKNEHDILLLNSSLINDIIVELKKFKQAESAYRSMNKEQLAGKITDVFNQYNLLTKATFVALTLLLVIVLYNIWKIFANEREVIEESEKTLQYANKKSIFMANMSHEIRTPLNSIVGFSEQLGMGRLSAEQTEQINAIRSSSQMLLEVVNEVLDFSKFETGKMNFEQQPFMPYKALIDVLNNVSISAAKKGLVLKKDILFSDDVCFSGDAHRLRQVVMNLLNNAIKFTPSGSVGLQASLINKGADNVLLKIRIKDTGIGMRKQDIPKIFEEFSQITNAQRVTHHKGTGLGLAICKKIVELQGGRIKVNSETGKGSIFSFEIPFKLADPALCVEQQMISDAELLNKVEGAHILLAEDNQLNILLAKTILKKWKITCDVAQNGQEAVELFEDNSYDMVLTDIQMPIMGGLELLSLIRNNANHIKAEAIVVALTANVLKEQRDQYMQAGMNDIILKPFVERSLIEKIASFMVKKHINTEDILFRYG